jgi:heterodisulfide reductase subunit A
MANIREHCSWVHPDRDDATDKATELVRMSVEKVRHNDPLTPIKVPVTRRALVIGGGVAGIQAALDIADGGYEVVMVEREPSIGGKMAGLSETFPTLDCSQCILTPRMVEVGQHPRIKLYTYSEVEAVDGFIGNFTVTIRNKARYVDIAKCTGCGECWNVCPLKNIPSEFEQGMGKRRAIYVTISPGCSCTSRHRQQSLRQAGSKRLRFVREEVPHRRHQLQGRRPAD